MLIPKAKYEQLLQNDKDEKKETVKEKMTEDEVKEDKQREKVEKNDVLNQHTSSTTSNINENIEPEKRYNTRKRRPKMRGGGLVVKSTPQECLNNLSLLSKESTKRTWLHFNG